MTGCLAAFGKNDGAERRFRIMVQVVVNNFELGTVVPYSMLSA